MPEKVAKNYDASWPTVAARCRLTVKQARLAEASALAKMRAALAAKGLGVDLLPELVLALEQEICEKKGRF